MSLTDHRVAVLHTGLKGYPDNGPFHPPEMYPEYQGKVVDPHNHVYAGVRTTLRQLGLDRENYGTPDWNPFKEFIKPGMTVFIKPNTVSHRNETGSTVFAVITHASVVRAVMDYVCLALRNQGRIVVGDSQFIFSLFAEAMQVSGIHSVLAWYRQQTDIAIDNLDLRQYRAAEVCLGRLWKRTPVAEIPRGYRWIDLGEESCHRGTDPNGLRIGVGNHRAMKRHHASNRHEYLFPQVLLDSDAVVHIPKLKTHRRGAVSLAIKSYIGFPSDKDSLPHYRVGSPDEGGDQYPHRSRRKRLHTWLNDQMRGGNASSLTKFLCAGLKKAVWSSRGVFPFKDQIDEAMWHGNDTLWRTLLDLVRIANYADQAGQLQDTPQRSHFYLIDGIIGGEGNGPLAPDPVEAGCFVAGSNPVAVDATAASLMGFDITRLPQIAQGLADASSRRPIYDGSREDIQIIRHDELMSLEDLQARDNLHFAAHPSWLGRIERGEVRQPQGVLV